MKNICVLDIETSYDPVRELCDIYIVGVKVFKLESGSYKSDFYKVYQNNELKQLEIFLNGFEGLIIGHNILGFDFRVLNTKIDINENVTSKTIDTLLWLKMINPNGFKGLSLNILGIQNLNLGKVKTEKSIPKLWREGKKREIYEYNERDCDLTFKLWQFLIDSPIINLRYYKNEFSLKLKAGQKKILKGESKFYENKNFGFITSMELFDFLNYETEYKVFYCEDCNSTSLIENRIVRGFAEFEMIRCQTCNSEFREIRTDGNYRSINIWYGDINKSEDYELQINLAKRNHILNTRDNWDNSRYVAFLLEVGELKLDDICDICSREISYVITAPNPLSENSVICYDCFSAERWLIFDI